MTGKRHMVKFKDVLYYQMQDNSDIFLFCLDRIKIYKVDGGYFETIKALSIGCSEEYIAPEMMYFFLSNDFVIIS